MSAHSIKLPGLLAGADLSSKQYHVVTHASTAGEVVQGTAGDTLYAGILQNDPADTEAADVMAFGVSIAVAGTDAITAGAALAANSTGQVVNTTTDNDAIVARALEDSGASGDEIRVLAIGGIRY